LSGNFSGTSRIDTEGSEPGGYIGLAGSRWSAGAAVGDRGEGDFGLPGLCRGWGVAVAAIEDLDDAEAGEVEVVGVRDASPGDAARPVCRRPR
jgi:hypothetical protein